MEFYGIARPGETMNLQFLNRYHIQKNKMPEILTFISRQIPELRVMYKEEKVAEDLDMKIA